MKAEGYWKLDTKKPEFYVIELTAKEVEELLQYDHQDSMADAFREIQEVLRKSYTKYEH